VIKSLVVPWIVASPEEGAALSRIFNGLGFMDGEGWTDRRSAGAPYLAPLGAIEIIHGTPRAAADLIVEVEDLQITHARLANSAWKSTTIPMTLTGARVSVLHKLAPCA